MCNPIRATAALAFILCASTAQSSIGSWIEPNLGQTDPAVKAIARDGELTLLLEPHRVRVLLPRSTTVVPGSGEQAVTRRGAQLLELTVEGADMQAPVGFGAAMTGVSRYFRGADDSAWLHRVTHHQSVRFFDVYPGIDLVYRLRDSRIEYDFLVEAGADPGQIALQLRGADRIASLDGDLVAMTGSGEFRQHAPEVFRVVDGELQPVAGQFELDGERFGFALAGDDRHDLVIDPVIEFSTYLGGSGDDAGSDIAVNNRGNLIVNGTTMSLDIPGAPGAYTLGGQDFFVAEIDRTGSQLLWISFIGGSGSDWSDALTVDSQGNIIAVGYTESSDFPTVNAFQTTFAGADESPSAFKWDGHVVKLSDDGSQLVFSTYYGGVDWAFLSAPKVGFEWFRGVEVDADDHIHVVGQTGAPDFPVTDNFRSRPCMDTDVLSVTSNFVSDIVLIEFAPDGTRLFATCIGGTERDAGRQIAFGPGGETYVGGFSRSSDLPVNFGAFQTVPPAFGMYAPFVLKLNPARSDIEWGTFFGGTGSDIMQEFAVGTDGAVYAAGSTASANFPVTPDALQPVINAGAAIDPFLGIGDAFAVKLRADGSALDYATFFGGAADDGATAMRIDAAGRIYFAGVAGSRDLILRTPVQSGPGNLYTSPVALAANGTINAMAQANFDFEFVAMARTGVNQLARRITDTDYEITDIGVQANDTRDVIAANFSSDFSNTDLVFIEAGAANAVYVFDQLIDVHVFDRTFGEASRDSRAAAALELGGSNSINDVVVANFGEANEIFLDAAGTPTLLGRADGNTVAVATGSFGGFSGSADVIFANSGQDIRMYRSIGNMLYSNPILLSGVSPGVSALATYDIDLNGTTDLIIGNAGGPLQVVRNIDGLAGAVEEIPGSSADTRSLFVGDVDSDGDPDLIAGNNGPDRLYVNDGSGNFTVVDEFPAIDSLTLSLAGEQFCSGCLPFAGGPDGLSIFRRNTGDLMVVVIDPDTGTLEFSTYLEGNGTEGMIRGLTLDSDGDVLIAASTDGEAWPQVGALQAGRGGKSDAVFIEIDVDVDDDGVLDGSDNCLEAANPLQRDTDNDAYGNFCDPDLDNDGVVNFADLQLFKDRIFSNDPDADLDGDGQVNFADLQLLKELLFGPPGPSGLLLP